MELTLVRTKYTTSGTFGYIVLPDGTKLYSCEREWANNGPRNSCIPIGKYKVLWRPSPRFGQAYRLQNVPKRDAILIHAANYPSELQGCIALGLSYSNYAVWNSRAAISKLISITEKNPLWLTVTTLKHGF